MLVIFEQLFSYLFLDHLCDVLSRELELSTSSVNKYLLTKHYFLFRIDSH